MKNRLKEIRKEKRLTLEQVGKGVGLSTNAISRYERGVREPKLETWQKLADFFNVPVDYLLGISKDRSTLTIDDLNTEEQEVDERITDMLSNTLSQEVSVPYLQWLDQEWYQAECLECGKVFRILSKEVDEINCCPFCKELYLSISKVN